jgi:hypothetical protein
MTGRVASASLLTDQYADKLAASLKHLEKRAPDDRKLDFRKLATELTDDREARSAGGPWGSAAG